MKRSINILFLAAEATPFIKVGGLADVAGSLPGALRNLPLSETDDSKLDVRLVIPLYEIIHRSVDDLKLLVNFTISTSEGEMLVSAYQALSNGTPVYFIEGDVITRSTEIYSADGEQDREKFIFFTISALKLAQILGWKVDVIHANDWHTAIALYIITNKLENPFYKNTSGLLTVHNLPYMGGDGTNALHRFGIRELKDLTLPNWASNQFLPMGIWAADAVVAVSKTYANEIMTPEFGCGLHGFLQSQRKKISGIINGLDLVLWDPVSDKNLISGFNADNLGERKKNKISLLHALKFSSDITIPLLGMVTRIDYQKGIDIAIKSLRMLLELRWNFVLLGSGDPYLEAELNQIQAEYPDRIRIILKYDDVISRQIYAGADIFMMPSRYEPCGLSQMIAMHYGCIPVVHNTGGLKDTVKNGENGFVFEKSDPESQANSLKLAFSVFSSPKDWELIQKNGMQKDFSWSRSAVDYASIYLSLVSKKISRR